MHHFCKTTKFIYQDKVLEVTGAWCIGTNYHELEVKQHIKVKGMNLTEQHPNIMFEDLLINGYTKI